MELVINGVAQTLIPIQQFRAEQGLPDHFGLATIEPKTRSVMGDVSGAGAALNNLQATLLPCVPETLRADAWLNVVPSLSATFERQLRAVNAHVQLNDAEIFYAVDGFEAVCGAVAVALARCHYTGETPPPFHQLYGDWLMGTVRVSYDAHSYQHADDIWALRVIRHAYGRVGLLVETPDASHYVADSALACPTQGFMFKLLQAVAERMVSASFPLQQSRASEGKLRRGMVSDPPHHTI